MARKNETRNVLVTRFSALGDVAMTLPVVYDACAANPAMNFVMLTRPLPAKMFLCPPPNLKVVAVNLNDYKGIAGMRRLLAEMVDKHGIDTVVDLHDVLRTKLIRLFARMRGLRVAGIDKGRKARKALTRQSKKAVVQLTPMPTRYRETFDKAGIYVAESFKSLFPSGNADLNASEFNLNLSKGDETWLAIAPFAAHDGKIYPTHLMERIIDHYADLPGFRIFVFGAGQNEEKEIERMAKGRGNVVSMAARNLGLPAELALMSNCDTMLAMDSANMHLASLVGLRTVSVWGATHPFTGFYGFRQDISDAVQLEMVCRPCSIFGNKPCRRHDYHCLNGISPSLIISRIDAKLKSVKSNE